MNNPINYDNLIKEMSEQFPLLPRTNKNHNTFGDFYIIEINEEDDPTSVLHNEIMLKIFSHFDVEDLGRISSVNKRWKELASDDVIWKRLYNRDYLELDTDFAHYKYEYWKRLIQFNSKEDFTEYFKDVGLEFLTKKQRQKILCWHYTLHNPIVDLIGYILFILFSILVPLKLDEIFKASWFFVFLPAFISFIMMLVRIFSVIPDRMAMMKHGATRYNPKLTRQGGFIYCFAHHHRKKYPARIHLFILASILFVFFIMVWSRLSEWKVSDFMAHWTYAAIPLIIFFSCLIQVTFCGCGVPHFKKSGRWIFLLFLIPIEIIILLSCLKLDGVLDWSWWVITSPSWFLYIIVCFVFLLTWMNVLKDSIFQKRQGCCNVLYSGLSMAIFFIFMFGPIIVFQLLVLFRLQYSWNVHYWVSSIPLFIQEFLLFPIVYMFWKKYY
eukprot:TRINITY_DN8197_c0_g1_i1.p1 TRINITY_DN8197_c0_g1~~TRINITY_DN8197_c0_g1_i1.p1  ORF type:complete len:439 (+),score=55.88 TRINITY_DN8197_c0_g1_i1:138-1454(+)